MDQKFRSLSSSFPCNPDKPIKPEPPTPCEDPEAPRGDDPDVEFEPGGGVDVDNRETSPEPVPELKVAVADTARGASSLNFLCIAPTKSDSKIRRIDEIIGLMIPVSPLSNVCCKTIFRIYIQSSTSDVTNGISGYTLTRYLALLQAVALFQVIFETQRLLMFEMWVQF